MAIEWNDEKQARLDALRASQLAGTLDDSDEAELNALIELLEVEERERLGPVVAQMRKEQTALRRQVQESKAANEQLVSLAVQQEQWLTDARRLLNDLERRHQAIQKAYQSITDEPVVVA